MIYPTKNLSIRPYENVDMPIVKKWFYSGDYPEFFRDMLALTEEQLKVYSYMKDGQGYIIWKGADPIGFIILYQMALVPANVKLSILIDKNYQGQKYCIEAMIEMGNYIFNRLRMKKLIVEVMESSSRLRNILIEGGFEEECVLKNEAKLEDKWVNVIRYIMFDEQFVEMKNVFGGQYGKVTCE